DTSQARGLPGTPSRGHCSSAARKASCSASSARSKSPSSRISVASTARDSDRYTDAMRVAVVGSVGATMGGRTSGVERVHVDDEAVAHVALQHALVGLVDGLHADRLDVGDDAMLGAEVEHLLGFGDAADQRTGQ